MKKIIFSSILFVCLIVSCNKTNKSEISPEIKPNQILAKGKIEFLGNVDPNKIKIIAGFNEGKIMSSKKNMRLGTTSSTEMICEIPLNKSRVQLISAVNDKGEFVSMCISNGDGNTFEMNLNTSAQSLLFLNPFFVTKDSKLAQQILFKIKESNTCEELTVELEDRWKASLIGAGSALDFTKLIGSDLGYYFESLEYDLSRQIDLKAYIDDKNGIKFISPKLTNDGKKLSFKVENNRKRWVQIAIDKYNKVGDSNPDYKNSETFSLNSFTNLKSWDYLLPSPNDYELKTEVFDSDTYKSFFGVGDFWQRYANNERLKTVSNLIESDVSNFEKVEIKVYGIGFEGIPNFKETDIDRIITPAAFSISFDLIIPIIDIILGSDTGFENIGEKPSTMNFIKKISSNMLKELDYKELFQKKTNYLDDAKGKLKIVVNTAFRTIANDEATWGTLIELFIENNLDAKVFGKNVLTEKMLKNVVPYFKAIEVGFKAYNIGDFAYTILTGSSINTYPFYTGKTDLTKGLVMHMPCESKVEELTGKFTINTVGNNIKLIDGAKGKGYSFSDEYSFIRMKPRVSIDFSEGHTFSHWIKLNDYELNKMLTQVAFSFETNSNWIVSYYGTVPNEFRSRENSKNEIGQKCLNTYESPSATDGKWHHVVWTAGNNWERGYIDGNLSYSFNCDYLTFNRIYDLFIGRYGKTGEYQLNGAVDEFRIYNRSLNDAEIQQLYQEGTVPKSMRTTVSQIVTENQNYRYVHAMRLK